MAALGAKLGAEGEQTQAKHPGREKFELYCMACHKDAREDPMLAPPVFALKRHYGWKYGEDADAFAAAIVEWVKAPSEEKSLMPGARQKWGLMPALPFPEADLKLIGAYLSGAKVVLPSDCSAHDPSQCNSVDGQDHSQCGKAPQVD